MTPDSPPSAARTVPAAAPAAASAECGTVSAIVLSRNGAAMLDRLFESLVARNTQELAEIILIDHGSTDETSETVRRWAGVLPIAHVRFRANHSYSWSANRAAERARGDYLVFLNNDIVLTEDILPAMLARARASGGIVGIRQMQADRDGAPVGRVQHVGVGFRWHPGGLFWNPYHLDPRPEDAELARGTVEMAVVTGSVMMVSRKLYLEFGGHDESYFYGFEDVDFCLKASLGHGLPVTSLNGISALHSEGGTRGAVVLRARRERARANAEPFIRRWDYPLRRHIRRVGLSGDARLLGACAPIALAGPPGSLLDSVVHGLGKPVLALDDLAGPAVVCVTDPAYALCGHGFPCPSIAVVGLAGGDAAAWLRAPDLPAYDLLVAEDEHIRAALRAAGAAAASAPADVGGALRERAEFPRVGLICLRAGPAVRSARLALAGAGIASRVHGLTAWRGRLFIDDDVIVSAGPLSPPNLPHRPVVPLSPPGTLVGRVLDADRTWQQAPRDAPLPDLARRPYPADA